MGDLTVQNQAADPSAPSVGFRRLYPKSDGWYDEDQLGAVTKLGNRQETENDIIATRVFS